MLLMKSEKVKTGTYNTFSHQYSLKFIIVKILTNVISI